MINPAEDAVGDATAADVPADGKLAKVAEAARYLLVLQRDEARLEAELADVKDRRFKVETEELPTAMDEAQVASFTTLSGHRVEVKPFYSGTVPTLGTITKCKKPVEAAELLRRREFALEWLREHDHHGIIKCEVFAEFKKGQESEAHAALATLREMGVAAQIEDNVHPATFLAWVRECLEQDIKLPLPELGVFVGRKAIIR